ncbi:hypothetical protein FBY35_4267 [Streptomyces sp. SLBN-118]|uniref:Rv1733c family protein n=1 Tax=Streptomyces sp. SLBN-118 TaxID=2768454 RepID=UPI0011510260|nr:hypothetical protein [Streptomyces sp. SLBN-118]TQK42825.1 hypothetical protein FBY35_4267 [Streptomyces sp. SLBN-118]
MTADLPGRGRGTHSEPERGTPRGNPLRRRSDRVQRWVGASAVVLSLGAVPGVATVVGLAVHQSEMHKVQEAAASYMVEARLAADAGTRKAAARGDDPMAAQVQWKQLDGVVRTAKVRVDPGTPAGSAIQIWVRPDGTATRVPPTTSSEAVLAGWLTAIVTGAGVSGACYVSWKGFVYFLDRRRYAQWEREWEEAEPGMSGRTQDL